MMWQELLKSSGSGGSVERPSRVEGRGGGSDKHENMTQHLALRNS